jgi:hypothetical protein
VDILKLPGIERSFSEGALVTNRSFKLYNNAVKVIIKRVGGVIRQVPTTYTL